MITGERIFLTCRALVIRRPAVLPYKFARWIFFRVNLHSTETFTNKFQRGDFWGRGFTPGQRDGGRRASRDAPIV